MKISDALDAARLRIARGWAEPFSLDAAGKALRSSDVGIARICLDDALLIAAGGDGPLFVRCQEAVVEQLLADCVFQSLNDWLGHPTTKHRDVLALLTAAVLRAKAREAKP